MTDLFRILVVCTGNVCRSPMAEGFLAAEASMRGLDHLVLESAGTHAPEGCPPSSLAIQAAAELGADIQSLRAAYLDRHRVETADLIVVMEPEHQAHILKHWPEEAAGKVRLIREFHPDAPSTEEVADPMGATLPFYRDVALLLMECCKGVIQSI